MSGLEESAAPPQAGVAPPPPASGSTGAQEAPLAAAREPQAGSSEPPPDPMIGQVIAGRYRVDARLGEGGMGSVYRVEHTHMRKRFALKVLHREMTNQAEIVARFEREAMAAAHIAHPNVAAATDFGKLEDGSCYLVLEYVEGPSLRALIDEGPLSPERAGHVAAQILAALKRAHELGIVHRDLKPENVLLERKEDDPDFVKVLDFGIARVPIGAIGGADGPSLTRAGMVYGTPEYMAPEQALGQEVDGRSDLYGVAVMLFEMLVGKRPYENKDKVALLGQHVAGPIPSVKARAPAGAIGPELDAVLTKMLAKSPSDRYQDAAAAAEAILAAVAGRAPISQMEFAAEPGEARVVLTPPHDAALELGPTVRPPPSPAPGEPVVEAAPSAASTSPLASPLAVSAHVLQGAHVTQGAPGASRRLPAVVAVVAALVLALALGKGLFGREPAAPAPGDSPAATSTVSGSASVASVASVASGASGAPKASAPSPALLSDGNKGKVQSALGRVTAGEVEQGIRELEGLAADHPNDPVVLKAMAQAYGKAKRHVDALGVVKRLIVGHPEVAADPMLASVFDDALASPGSVEPAFALLEGAMKSEGARTLYAMAYEGRGPQALAGRAKKSLADPEVSGAMSPALRSVVELRNAPFVCAARKDVIEKHREHFDALALPVLKGMTKTTGCGGFFKRGDCWPCLREDGLLAKVIAAVEERTKK